jgi:parvulin-like peptidyl-prolyl isomerase
LTCAALLGLAAGCGGGGGGDEKIVAEAGDIQITLGEFHQAYNQITPNARPDISTLEGRRTFANDLLNKEIVLAEGRRVGLDPSIEGVADQTMFQKMLEALYRTEISEKIDVLGEDVAKVYEHRNFNVKGSHILVQDGAEAEEILAEIRSGKTSFAAAAEKYSLDQSTRANGGAMQEIYWSMALPDFQLALFEMEPGEMKTIDGTIGGHVLKLDEKIAKEQPTLEEMRPQLRSDVRRQLEAVRMREYLRELEAKAGLTWNEEGLDLLVRLIEANTKVDIDTVEVEERFIPAATGDQAAAVVASFSGRDWTVGDFVEGLRKMPAAQRPPGALPKRGLRELIRSSQIRDELLRAEAYAAGLDKDEAIQAARARHVEQLLTEQVHFGFLQAADVPEERVRAVFDSSSAANPEALLIPERLDMVLLVHTDSVVVAQGLARIRAGEPEEEVIEELSMDFRTAIKGGRTGLMARGNYAPQLEDAAFAAKAGSGWSQPVVTQSGTGAFRIITHEEPRNATFEELKDQLTTTLIRNEGERAFEEWLQKERDRRGVQIHDEALELIGQSVS